MALPLNQATIALKFQIPYVNTTMKLPLLFSSYLTTLLLIFVGLVSCGRSSPTNNGNPTHTTDTTDTTDTTELPVDFSFKMTINQVPWEADTAVYRDPVLPGDFAKEIEAWKKPKDQAEKILISLPSPNPGTYPITSDPITVSVNFTANKNPPGPFDPDPTPAAEGKLVILESTSEFISGTFSFKGTSLFGAEIYEGTSGAFKVRAE